MQVRSDVVLASASGLLIDIQRGASDQLKIFSDAEGTGALALTGGSLLLTQVPGAASLVPVTTSDCHRAGWC